MKTILFLGFVLISSSLFATTPPKEVIKAFNQRFPNATKVKWDKENANEYEASFKLNRLKYSANFSLTGEWMETESPIKFNELPQEVQKAFLASYKKAKAVSKIENSKGKIIYEIEVKQGIKTIEKFYNSEGTETKE